MPSAEIPLADIMEALDYSEEQLYEQIARAHHVEAGFKIGDIPTLVRAGGNGGARKKFH